MAHIPDLINDLALILISAGIVTILFKWLKQPVVLGYIIAGFLIGPHFNYLPSVADVENISVWSEIGVIFLLFALGLEFSFKKLMAVGGTATIATLINMGSMIAIGYLIGQAMNWSQIECLFLGSMLSMSSTTIIIKAFNDMGLQKKKFANIVFGMLIVEDLAAILVMVLLSTIAVSQHFEGTELVGNLFKLVFFMLIWFVSGIFLIPSVLKKLKKYLNDETLLVVAVGLCLGMVMFASSVGFSAALGAFIMGSILAETIESKHIEHLIEPLKNLFGAVFFVSVGMSIIPGVIVEYSIPIIIFTVVVLIGRVIFATLGVLASGEGLKVSLQSGFSLAQIGEFSFIIATLGMQLGVISDFIYPIIVTVSVLTTFTTPYFIKVSDPFYGFIERRLPQKWNKLLLGYAASNIKSVTHQNDWKKLLKSVLPYVIIYFTLALAVYFISRNFLYPLITDHINGRLGIILAEGITIILMAPFISAIVTRRSKSHELKVLWDDSLFNKAILISLNLLKFGMSITLIAMVLIPLFPRVTGLLILISTIIAIVIAFSQGFRDRSQRMEERFFDNLNNKELSEKKDLSISEQLRGQLQEKSIYIEEFEVPQNSPYVGKTLGEIHRERAERLNIVCIIRGKEKINIPGENDFIYPFDKIVIAGTEAELQYFMSLIETHIDNIENIDEPQYQIELSQYQIEPGSILASKSIKELGVRNRTECMITGIERNGNIIANFKSDFILEQGDVLWLAGEKQKLEEFEQKLL